MRLPLLSAAPSEAEGSMPSEPVSIAAQSDRMSPNRLLVTITSNCLGLRTSCIAQLSADFAIEVIVDTTDPSGPFMELVHKTRDDREGDLIVRDRIRLLWTVPTFGGRRWWFQCPRTGRRTTKLFLPNGGQHFWSRAGCGLGYACQREGRFDRLQRRAAMLNRQLGGKGWRAWEDPPTKPKWMRRRTYERKYENWERVVERANAEFTLKAMRILRRPAVPRRLGRSRRP